MATRSDVPKHWSMLPWIAAPKPARNDESLEAGGKPGQMRSPWGRRLVPSRRRLVPSRFGAIVATKL